MDFNIEQIRQAGADGKLNFCDVEHLIQVLITKHNQNKIEWGTDSREGNCMSCEKRPIFYQDVCFDCITQQM